LTIDAGADARYVEGSTNELFQYTAGNFTRVRAAGGSQIVGGAFTEATWTPQPSVVLTASGRVDYWKQMDGFRHEVTIAPGPVLRDDHYASRDGTEGNFRVGARVNAAQDVALHAAAYSGFRVPTINELYRPFRVGNDITEANPLLKPERLYGVEGGVDVKLADRVSADATLFYVRMNNAVGNVTLQTTPGLNPETGAFVPAGGTLRQRQNLDRVRSEGAELNLTWRVVESFDLTARYLYTDPKITKNAGAPALIGLQLPEVAKHQVFLEAAWTPLHGTVVKADLHASSGQYDDDQNTRHLGGYTTADLYLEQTLNSYASVFVSGENIFNRTVPAGLSADGLLTIGMPRVVSAGVRWKL
jgi:outer membrane receptor protein involved in Fe transport